MGGDVVVADVAVPVVLVAVVLVVPVVPEEEGGRPYGSAGVKVRRWWE